MPPQQSAKEGAPDYGCLSNPFLCYSFKTAAFHIKVTVNDDGTWGYSEDTVLKIKDQVRALS